MARDGAQRGSPPDAVTVIVTVVRKPPEAAFSQGHGQEGGVPVGGVSTNRSGPLRLVALGSTPSQPLPGPRQNEGLERWSGDG